MTFLHRGRDSFDSLAVGDVANLVLASDLVREPAQRVLPSAQQDARPALVGEPSREGGSDPGSAARDDGDARLAYLQTRTRRLAATRRPPRVVTTARSTWRPRLALRAAHVAE